MSFVADSGGEWDRPAAGGGDNWGNQGGPVAGGWNDAQGSDTMGQDNFGCNDADFGYAHHMDGYIPLESP